MFLADRLDGFTFRRQKEEARMQDGWQFRDARRNAANRVAATAGAALAAARQRRYRSVGRVTAFDCGVGSMVPHMPVCKRRKHGKREPCQHDLRGKRVERLFPLSVHKCEVHADDVHRLRSGIAL